MPDAVEVVLEVVPEAAGVEEAGLVAEGAEAGQMPAAPGQGPARDSSGEAPTTTGAW